MKTVISLGGSLITGNFNAKSINKYAEVLRTIQKDSEKLVVVIGGGKPAREYIKVIKDMGLPNNAQDNIAITITHANAKLMALTLNHNTHKLANETIPRTEKEITEILNKYSILICGGTIPGQSTDSVSAKIARELKADLLINASDIDGVYDSDPKKNKNAKKYKSLTYDEFYNIINQNEQSPGKYALFDKKAAEIIRQEKIKTIMIDGTDPKELERATKGTHCGTTIH